MQLGRIVRFPSPSFEKHVVKSESRGKTRAKDVSVINFLAAKEMSCVLEREYCSIFTNPNNAAALLNFAINAANNAAPCGLDYLDTIARLIS